VVFVPNLTDVLALGEIPNTDVGLPERDIDGEIIESERFLGELL
jgi:hypothetical protein